MSAEILPRTLRCYGCGFTLDDGREGDLPAPVRIDAAEAERWEAYERGAAPANAKSSLRI